MVKFEWYKFIFTYSFFWIAGDFKHKYSYSKTLIKILKTE